MRTGSWFLHLLRRNRFANGRTARVTNQQKDVAQMTDRELCLKALGIAGNLTYNEEQQGEAKRVIGELVNRLWAKIDHQQNAAQGGGSSNGR